MARAYGSNALLLLKRESTYGQQATGNYYKMPFTSSNLGSEQGLIEDPVLGFGRDPAQPLRDVINADGDIVIPVDPRYLGLWLAGIFGDPTSSGHVLGIDMATALKIAEIRGYNAAIVSELLQEAEAVIVALMNERPEFFPADCWEPSSA